MVFENALAKSQAVFDVIKFGRDKGAFVPSNLMNNIMKATKEARITHKHIEAIFQQKLKALKKALQSTGVDVSIVTPMVSMA
jgi:transcriptional regulator NrdR family protein